MEARTFFVSLLAVYLIQFYIVDARTEGGGGPGKARTVGEGGGECDNLPYDPRKYTP